MTSRVPQKKEIKGNELPQFNENDKGNFKIPYGLIHDTQQKVLINAIWRSSTPTGKVKALNALSYYFSYEVKRDYTCFVIFEGPKSGIYNSWGDLQKKVGRRNVPKGWRGYYDINEAEKAYADFLYDKPEASNRNFDTEVTTSLRRIDSSQHLQMKGDISHQQFSVLMNLKKSFRTAWLKTLPRDVSQAIQNKVFSQFYMDIKILQEIMGEFNEDEKEGFDVVQYQGHQDSRIIQPLVARIEWEVFNIKDMVKDLYFQGFLLMLELERYSDVPDFFGDKVQALIRAYKKTSRCIIHFVSTGPKIQADLEEKAAQHELFLSRTTPILRNYTSGPFKIDDSETPFLNYYPDFKSPNDDWELLGETLTSKVWVPLGTAFRSRSVTPIPGIPVRYSPPISRSDYDNNMDLDGDGASTD